MAQLVGRSDRRQRIEVLHPVAKTGVTCTKTQPEKVMENGIVLKTKRKFRRNAKIMN